jgi:hypothetical protein
MADHVDSEPAGQGQEREPDLAAGPAEHAEAVQLPSPSPQPSPLIGNLWPAGRFADSAPAPGHVIDLDSREEQLYCRQPPRTVIHSEPVMVLAGTRYRCIHRRPFSCQMENGVYVVRDIHVLGPWRPEREAANQDARTFAAAFHSSREKGLHGALRLAHRHRVTLFSRGFELCAWELEVEMRSNGSRLARGVLYGYRSLFPPRVRFIVQGKWVIGRTKGEYELNQMLTKFAADPNSIVKPFGSERSDPY